MYFILYFTGELHLCIHMQMLMNVRGMRTTVMRMRSALTQTGVTPAFAILAILEMGSTVLR